MVPPVADHLTLLLEVPVTVAENCCEAPGARVVTAGKTVIVAVWAARAVTTRAFVGGAGETLCALTPAVSQPKASPAAAHRARRTRQIDIARRICRSFEIRA
jgi:hypothetical protein